MQQADAAFYSINPGGPSVHLNQISTRAQNAMESIAQSTGGTAFVPDGEKDLERVFSEVAAELRGQYLLQYYSNSQAAGTQFRRIAVTHTGPILNCACALARATTRKASEATVTGFRRHFRSSFRIIIATVSARATFKTAAMFRQ